MEKIKNRNLFIDLYKCLLAVFVIFIHFGNSKFTYVEVAFFRLAIAGFAAITGFYIFKNNLSHEEKVKKAKNFLLKSLKYFGFAVIFAFITQMIITWIAGVPTIEGLKMFAFDIAPFLYKTRPVLLAPPVIYHLWYFQGMVLVSAIYYAVVALKIEGVMFVFPLLVIPLYWAQTKWPLTQNPNYQFLYRNSWFMILPSFAGGWITSHFKETKFKIWIYPILVVVLGGLICLQIVVQKHYPIEMTFIAVIIASLVILLLDRIPVINCAPIQWVCGLKIYAVVYVVHLFVGTLLNIKFGINPYVQSFKLLLWVFIVSIIISVILYFLKFLLNKLKQKKNTL